MSTTKTQTNGATRKRRLPPPVEIGSYLVSDPEVYHGELTFKGTRIPVRTILTFLGMGESIDKLHSGYDHPRLYREAMQEAVALAKQALIKPFALGNGRKLNLNA